MQADQLEQDCEDDYDESLTIVMRKASEPIDILWRNMGYISSQYAFTRIFLFVLGMSLILFLSSPVVMINQISQLEGMNWVKFTWATNDSTIGFLIHKSGPPLLVILINLLVIILLDFASVFERYHCHSKYQTAVYNKTVIYTSLNMFIIPVLTQSGGASIYGLITNNNFDFGKILGELFIPKSGEFFALLLIQQGAISGMFYGLMIGEISGSFFKPYYAVERRKMYNDQQPWRRDEQLTFLYGYFNSQIMTMFMICVFYAPTVPMVPIAAAFFVKIRHYVDGYNLLTFFRKEIDTSGQLIDSVTNHALMIVFMYQICMTAYFTIHNRREETIACALILLVSSFYSAITYENIYDLASIDDVLEKKDKLDDIVFQKWKDDYNHPLCIKRRSESLIRRVNQDVNNNDELNNVAQDQQRNGGDDRAYKNVPGRLRNTKLFELTKQPKKMQAKAQ
jgi:hypothetical protein